MITKNKLWCPPFLFYELAFKVVFGANDIGNDKAVEPSVEVVARPNLSVKVMFS